MLFRVSCGDTKHADVPIDTSKDFPGTSSQIIIEIFSNQPKKEKKPQLFYVGLELNDLVFCDLNVVIQSAEKKTYTLGLLNKLK